jgi:NhaC family Na+:H+ antiporter
MQMDAVITAGAVVSGAYFGDKISPLSETTNLAPAVAGTELFSHIRYMLLTTIPSFIITLIIFTLISLNTDTQATDDRIAQMQSLLNNEFSIGLLQLVPLFILLGLALKKMPAFPAVFIGGLLGGMWAWLFQAEVVISMAPQGQSGFTANLMVVWQALFDGVSFSTPDDNLNDLLSRGGMSNMLDTVWLIICAMTFGAVLEKVGLLKKGVSLIMQGARSVGSTVSRTMLTCLGANILTADQYISIVMPGRMFKQEFSKRGLHQLNLSRSLEDGGTLTSPLIPWNTCGAYMHSVLMINPFDYIFYAFFNLINPVLSAIYAYLGINILRIAPENPQQVDVEVSRA